MSIDKSELQAAADAMNRALAPLKVSVENQITLERLALYCVRLAEKNEVMNLTAVSDTQGIYLRHFADSLAAVPFLGRPARLIDVGCGAGFPGLPLKIFFDGEGNGETELTLLDSTAKKLNFLQELAAEMGLKGVTCLACRAEEAGSDPAYRETYDAAVSRAVANLPALSELALPFVKPGGLFVPHKSARSDEEIAAAANAVRTLGGELVAQHPYTIEDRESRILVIEKRRKTPPAYPRSWGKIKNKPL